MKVPLTKPFFDHNEFDIVKEVLDSGWVTQGPKVQEFEKRLAQFIRAKNVIAVSNCTTALHLCMLISAVFPGDEVLVPSLTYIATANAIKYTGATPVFVDIELDTYNIDPQDIEKRITKKTKAIVAVHQIGLAANLGLLRKIAHKHHLILIEDAAPALGATFKKEMVGEKGLLVAFSLHPRKSITTGEGGFIATNNNKFAKELRILRSHGATKSDFSRHTSNKIEFESFHILGYNYRLSDVAAAIGIAQLKKLPKIISMRRKLAENYIRDLKKFNFIMPSERVYSTHTYQSFQIRIEGILSRNRDNLISWLLEQGIVTRRGVMACHLEPLYKSSIPENLPNTEKVYRESLLLPLFPGMTELQQEYVIEKLKTGIKKFS